MTVEKSAVAKAACWVAWTADLLDGQTVVWKAEPKARKMVELSVASLAALMAA